jgi:hypothetical protein
VRLALFIPAAVLFLGASANAQSPVGPPNAVLCNGSVVMEVGPTTTQKLVSNVPGKNIFVCGWHITNTGATGTFSITSGTQTTNPCDTNIKKMTPVMNVTSTAPSADHVDFAQFQVNAGSDLCFTPSVATIAVLIWFGQY